MATFLPGVTDVFPGPAPFEPDFQFIDTMLKRRQTLYEQGFSQVSNSYKAINRNLTNPLNAQSRDKFLRQAEENLKDLSAMDLSLPQNVDSANGVFKPFYQNTDILADMSLTNHWDQQESVANMYRTKDGGKEFSEDNINYVRMQRNQFAKENPANWRGYMQNKRSYTPYYNWNQEFLDNMKYYKPDNVSIKRRNGMYNIVEENKGASAQDLKLFFSSMASTKAKEQMRIEAAVRIGSSPEAIAPLYKNVAERDLATYTERLQNLETEIKVAPTNEARTLLEGQRSQLMEEIKDRQTDIDKIKKGDIEFLRANGSKMAFALYFDDAVSRMAQGLSWKDYKYDFTGDDVAMLQYKEAQAMAREVLNQQGQDRRKLWDLEAERLKNKREGKKGDDDDEEGPVNVMNAPSFNNQTVQKSSMNSLQTQILDNNQQKVNNAMLLKKHVAQVLKKKESEVTPNDIVIYGKSQSGQSDKVYFSYKDKISQLSLQNDIIEKQIQSAEDYAVKTVGRQAYNEIEKNLKQLDQLGRDKGISGSDMYHAVINGMARLERGTDSQVVTGPNVGANAASSKLVLTVNGKSYDVRANDNLVKMYNMAKNFSEKSTTKNYNQAFNNYFSENTVVPGTVSVLSNKDKRYVATQGLIGTITGLDATKIGGVLYGQNNDVYFSLDSQAATSDWDKEKKRVIDLATQYGLEIKVNDNTKQFYMREIPGLSKVKLGNDIYKNFNQFEKTMINFMETQAEDGYNSPHFYPGGKMVDPKGMPIKPFKVSVIKDPGSNTKVFYLYNDAVSNSFIESSSSLVDLMTKANTIADDYTNFMGKVMATAGR
jgi:hypothetical protein